MDSFIFAVSAVLPLIIVVLVGYLLSRSGIIPDGTSRVLNKMVFRAFLPCMLFLNIYKIESIGDIDFGYIVYAIVALLIVYAIALPVVMAVSSDGARRGVLLQSVFRSNFALIGIPLAISLCGQEGAIIAAVLSGFAIPVFNALAVVSLSVFRGGENRVNVKRILLDILKNPLIQSVFIGFVALAVRAIFIQSGITWRLTDMTPVYTSLESLSSVATPLALVSLGAQFKFSAIGRMKRELIFAVLTRIVIVPLSLITVAYLFFDFEASHFASFVALFATPVAVSSVPMAQEMGADSELAGQIVVWSTALSGVTIFLFTLVLKALGVF